MRTLTGLAPLSEHHRNLQVMEDELQVSLHTHLSHSSGLQLHNMNALHISSPAPNPQLRNFELQRTKCYFKQAAAILSSVVHHALPAQQHSTIAL